MNYPTRSLADDVNTAAKTAQPRPPFNPQANGAGKKPVVMPARQPGQTGQPNNKPEDKDSPEYKKKQALIAGPILNMSYQNANGYEMTESLFTSLKDVFEAVVLNQQRSGVISPAKFLEVLRKENEMFRSAMHQDAHEFLNLLLNSVVENIEAHDKSVKEKERKALEEKEKEEVTTEVVEVPKSDTGMVSFPSLLPAPATNSPTRWLHELFEGTLTSETRCLTCENVSQRDEPFLDLSVDLEQHSSVTACLRKFSEEEMLCERNKFHCDNCGGLQEAEKRMKIKRLPRVLALHLKRFKYTEDLQRLQKLFHKVVYPFHLRLFNTTDDAEDPDRIYELYAVVVHIGGGPYHGHYVAIIKTEDRGWLLFDDEMVEPVDKNYVKNFFGDKPGLACAYVLFYQETTLEAVQKEQRTEGKRRASQDRRVGLGVAAKQSAELHRVRSSPPMSPGEFVNLDHAATAPDFMTNGHVEPPKAETIHIPAPASPVVISKKERAKEEKARKAAEKEAEKQKVLAERERRKELAFKLGEAHKKQEADLQRVLEESKSSKVEEDKRRGVESQPESEQANGNSPSGLERFKRTRSLRFASLTKKDKEKAPAVLPLVASEGEPATDSNAAVVEDGPANGQEEKKEKRNRFSIRKKSFGMLS